MNFYCKILFFGFLMCLNVSNAQNGAGKSSPDAPVQIPKAIASLGRKMFTYLESISKPNENLLISPTNIFHAVALLHMAADGDTLKELSSLMGIPSGRNYSKTDIHSKLSSFYKKVATSDENPIIVNLADALFLRDGFKIKKDYQDNAVNLYQTQISNVNFGPGKGAPTTINRWVSEKTRGRISKVVDDSLDPQTEAIIISTLYFNAKWYNPFTKANTKIEKFSTGATEVDVHMMHLTKHLPYVNNAELQFESIDLPYDGYTPDYALNIILPYPNQTVKNLIPKLKDISINQIMEKQNIEAIDLKLPKIKFSIFKSLVAVFKYLGVNQLFTKANLQDLTNVANLRISEIQHGAELEINEAGTIATAFTAGHAVTYSLPPPILDPISFHVKRPFIVNIYERKTSLILFSGAVYQPELVKSQITDKPRRRLWG